MQIWLISDMHLFHENMYKFIGHDGVTRTRAKFTSAAEGDEYMIDAWNAVVKPEDHVWNLGDLTMERSSGDIWKIEKVMKSLHGHKRLILGNHDHYDVRIYRNIGFEKVKGSHRFDRLVYSHIPLHPEAISSDKILANVHGHIHDRPSPEGKYVNVSVERINYQPIPVEEVYLRAKERLGTLDKGREVTACRFDMETP